MKLLRIMSLRLRRLCAIIGGANSPSHTDERLLPAAPAACRLSMFNSLCVPFNCGYGYYGVATTDAAIMGTLLWARYYGRRYYGALSLTIAAGLKPLRRGEFCEGHHLSRCLLLRLNTDSEVAPWSAFQAVHSGYESPLEALKKLLSLLTHDQSKLQM